jgi:hypothetical protein
LTLLDRLDKFDRVLPLRSSIACALCLLAGCSSPERVYQADDTGSTTTTDTGVIVDTGMMVDTGTSETAGDTGSTGGGYTATATVPGGVRAESASYILITTTGRHPGGSPVLQSASYTLKGGIVSVTQP